MGLDVLLAAFGAGVFAAMIGALPVFIITGIMVVAGLTGGSLNGADGWNLIGTVGFGIFLGPHITFGGAVAAANFAKKKGYMETGDITVPLVKFNDASVLLVGGIFGVLAYVLNYLFATVLQLPTDTIALVVVISGMLARLCFSTGGLIPSIKTGNTKYFPLGDKLKMTVVLSLSIGMVSSYYAVQTGDTVLAWSLSAVALLFVQVGQGGYGFHHIGIIAAIAGSTTGNVYVGMIFGLFAGILADVLGAIFNNDGDSHIDAPALAIFPLTTVIMLFLK